MSNAQTRRVINHHVITMTSGVINGHGRLDLIFGVMAISPQIQIHLSYRTLQNLAMDIHGHQDLSLGSLVTQARL